MKAIRPDAVWARAAVRWVLEAIRQGNLGRDILKGSHRRWNFQRLGRKNHTCKITCKKSGLWVLTRTEPVPDGL